MKFTIIGEPVELWKDVDGYEGLYQVSNLGRVKSLDTAQTRSNGKKICVFHKKGQILKPYFTGKKPNRYSTVTINKKRKKIHRLVSEAFISNPHNLPQVNHIDGNKNNNCVSNLEWCDNAYNINHAFDMGLIPSGEKCKNARLTEIQVKGIREFYIKGDKECGAKPLARIYGVSGTMIRNILNNQKWRKCDHG